MLRRGQRVVLVGDSHMEALGPRLQRSLTARGVQVLRTEARRGWSTRGYLASGDLPGLAAEADVVIIELGGGDAGRQIGPEAHAQDVLQVLAAVRPAVVVWVSPGVTQRADLEAYRAPIRSAQSRVVSQSGGTWLNSVPLTAFNELGPDGVHFTRAGYDRWANGLLTELTVTGGSLSSGIRSVTATLAPMWPWLGPVAVGVAGLFVVGAVVWSRRRTSRR